jgi:acetyltransferase-like isoleucine patch superfamily enzyme
MEKYKNIIAKEIVIGENCQIADDVQINVRGRFEIGDCSIIKSGTTIQCEEFIAGEYLYMSKSVEIGRGGFTNKEAVVHIGQHVGIFENTLINPNSPVTIGDEVGIGTEVMIWTHGAWLDVTQGFPSDFGPVSIGNNVWLPARTIMLPNTSVGDNCVIGIGSIITKPIPSNSMAAGSPCRVIRENYYPRPLDKKALAELIIPMIAYWKSSTEERKGIKNIIIDYNIENQTIQLNWEANFTQFDIVNKTITGNITPLSEDLRDYLRRKGVKIFTGKPFVSLKSIV